MFDCYVTTTLLNSWQYYLKSQESYEEGAKEDFLNCLNKIKTPPTENMLKGIAFEEEICRCCEQNSTSDNDTVNEIVGIVKGGLWQETVSKVVEIQGLQVLLYGKCDFMKEDTIYDVKWTGKHKDLGKYLKNSQHKIYLYCSGLPFFKYLISDDKEVFNEDYSLSPKTESDVLSMVCDFFDWLKANNLFDLYLEKWKGKDKSQCESMPN